MSARRGTCRELRVVGHCNSGDSSAQAANYNDFKQWMQRCGDCWPELQYLEALGMRSQFPKQHLQVWSLGVWLLKSVCRLHLASVISSTGRAESLSTDPLGLQHVECRLHPAGTATIRANPPHDNRVRKKLRANKPSSAISRAQA